MTDWSSAKNIFEIRRQLRIVTGIYIEDRMAHSANRRGTGTRRQVADRFGVVAWLKRQVKK